jgi:predicted HTH transcriptional regulator
MKVQQLITKGESEVLEFKATFGKDVIETLCAFANHRGETATNDSRSKYDPVHDVIG